MRIDATTTPLLSPELVLVDPELAGTVRALLPPGGEGERWRTRFPTPPPSATTARVVRAPAARRVGRSLMLVTVAGIVCAAAAAVAYETGDSQRPYLVDVDDPEGGAAAPAPVAEGGVAGTSIAIRTSPAPAAASRNLPVRVRDGVRSRRLRPVRSVVQLGWTARPEATYYRVRIRRARRPASAPVLELRTARPSMAVRIGRGESRVEARVPPGTYRWGVYPVVPSRSGDDSTARPIATGTFTIAAPTGTTTGRRR